MIICMILKKKTNKLINKLINNLIKKEPPKKPTKNDVQHFNKLINKEEMGINRELFQRFFNFQMPSDLLKAVYITNDKKKNRDLVNVIISGLSDLKDEIEKMSEDEIKIEKPLKILDIVEEILHFNRQNPEGQGLKILTPNQMLSRLPITLSQLKSGNNSEKLEMK